MARACVERLRHALGFAREWGWAGVDATRGARLPRRQKRERVLVDVELELLFTNLNRTAHPHTRRAARTLAATGLRVAEVCRLRGNDLDERRGRVWIAKAKAGPRWAPVGASMLEQLVSWRIDTGFLFRTKSGRPLDPRTLRRALARASALAGIEKVVPHHLRHTFASRALLAGVPVHVVAALLGHSCPTVTLRTYAHVIGGDVSEAADRIAGDLLGLLTGKVGA